MSVSLLTKGRVEDSTSIMTWGRVFIKVTAISLPAFEELSLYIPINELINVSTSVNEFVLMYTNPFVNLIMEVAPFQEQIALFWNSEVEVAVAEGFNHTIDVYLFNELTQQVATAFMDVIRLYVDDYPLPMQSFIREIEVYVDTLPLDVTIKTISRI